MNKITNFLSRFWFALLMLLFFIILTAKFAFGQDVEIKDARKLIEADKVNSAVTLLTGKSQAYGNVSRYWYYVGYAQLKNGQRENALSSFEKGTQIDPNEPLNYVGIGHLSILENHPEQAKPSFDKALALSKSKNIVVLKAIAEAYLATTKQTDEAIKVLQKAKSLDSKDAETYILLGDAYLQQNNGGLAVSSYEEAIAKDPKLALPHYKIGVVYLRTRNMDAAKEEFIKATEVDAGYTLAYKELGELYYQMKDGANAVKAYETYLSLTDKPEVGKLRYAFFLFMAKDFTKASEIFKELSQKPEVSPITLRFYAISLNEIGDYQQSRVVFDQYFSKSPAQEIEASDYTYHGKLLMKQNEDSLAMISFQKSLAIEKNQPDVVQLMADSYFKNKKYPEAITSFNQLIGLRTKKVSQDYFTLGRAYYFNKQYEQADTTFQKLIELQPNMTVGYLWDARAKSNLDPESESGLAKPYYEKLIEKASATPDKNKNDLVEAYSYLGYYHFIKQEIALSKSYWQKVLNLKPDDAKAKEALRALN